jgi:hypothetical protein
VLVLLRRRHRGRARGLRRLEERRFGVRRAARAAAEERRGRHAGSAREGVADEAGRGQRLVARACARRHADAALLNRQLAGGLQPFAQAQTAFRQRFGSAITQELSAYAGDGARRVVDDFRTIVRSCPTWDAAPEPGRTVKYTLRPLAFPKLGDETVAARLGLANRFGGIEVDHSVVVAMIRRGNIVDFITQTANTGLFQPKAETETLARKADRLLASTR